MKSLEQKERDRYLSPFDREPAFLIAKRDIVNPTDSILSITLILKIHKSITCKRKHKHKVRNRRQSVSTAHRISNEGDKSAQRNPF